MAEIRPPYPKRSRRPLWLALAALALLAGLVLWIQSTSAVGAPPSAGSPPFAGGPRLQTDIDQADHGQVKLGVPIYDSVRVTNAGSRPLTFREAPYIEVKRGCCAPVPAIDSLTLQPGQSEVITLQYTMHPGMGGPHDFRLHLKTNDPTQPDRVVTLRSDWE